jgi:hypothetical protein
MISGRRREGQTLESFYHEFESTHVALMRQARCERFLNRYTQNKAMPINTSMELWAAVDTRFDSQASLAFDDFESMSRFFNDPDYNTIVKSHEFTDPKVMTVELCEEFKLKSGPVDANSVKVIYYFKPSVKRSREEFRDFIDGPYSELTIKPNQSLLSRHLRSYCYPPSQTAFLKSVFQKADVSQYGVIEELWFNNLDDMQGFHQGLKQQVQQALSNGIDFENSFSLIVSDRVVFGVR